MSEQTWQDLVLVTETAQAEFTKIMQEERAAAKAIRLVFAGFG